MKNLRPCIEGGERRKDPKRIRKDLSGAFEVPIWAHKPMKRFGFNPNSAEDWHMFMEHCE